MVEESPDSEGHRTSEKEVAVKASSGNRK